MQTFDMIQDQHQNTHCLLALNDLLQVSLQRRQLQIVFRLFPSDWSRVQGIGLLLCVSVSPVTAGINFSFPVWTFVRW